MFLSFASIMQKKYLHLKKDKQNMKGSEI